MQTKREIIFPELKYASGDYKILFGIDDTVNTNLILNQYDSDFDYLAGYVLHWAGYSGGATVVQEFNMLKVHTDAIIGGIYTAAPVIGKRYKITTKFFTVSGFSSAPINIYVGNVLIGSTSVKGTEVEFIFTATNSDNGIYLSCPQDFYCDYITLFNVELAHSVTIGDVKIGNDNDVDWIMYPGTFEFSFKITADNISHHLKEFDKWADIDFALNNYPSMVYLYKKVAGVWQLWFNNSIDNADIASNSKDKVFNIRAMDWMTYLKLDRVIDSHTDYEHYTLRKLSTIIQFLYKQSADTETVEFISQWKIIENGTTDEFPIEECYLNRIAIEYPADGLSGPSYQPWSTRGSVLKGILNNLASYMIAGFNQKIYIMPMVYNGGEIHTLYADEMPPLEKFSISKFAGLNNVEHNGTGGYTHPDRNDDYLDVAYPFGIGVPEYNPTPILYYPSIYIDEAQTRKVKNASAKYKQRDGTYSAEASFTEHCNSLILSQVNYGRYGYIAKPKGVDIPQNKFFEIRFSRSNPVLVIDKVFRAKQFLISPVKNRTSIWLVEC